MRWLTALFCTITPVSTAMAQDPVAMRKHTGDIYFWLIVLLVAVGLIVVTALLVRRLILRGDQPDHGPFLLSDIRRLHEQGEISDEEFIRVKQRLIARSQQTSENKSADKTERDKDTN